MRMTSSPSSSSPTNRLRFTARFDDITVGILLDEINGGVEGIEVFVGNDADAGRFELFLAEGAVVFEAVGVGGSADDGLAGGAKGLGFAALSQGVVKDDNVGPLGVFFPILGFRDKTVGDVTLLLGVDVVADVVAFLADLPSDVNDETREQNEEEFTFGHF